MATALARRDHPAQRAPVATNGLDRNRHRDHRLPRATARVHHYRASCAETNMRTFQLPIVTEIRRPRPIEPDTW